MKSVLRYTAAGLALASFGFASAASAATGTAQATAEILTTLTVTASATDDTLDFGKISPTPTLVSNSSVTVAPNGTATCGVNLACSGTANAPTFNVNGLVNSVVAVSFPSSTASLVLVSGTAPSGFQGTMTVGAFTTSASSLTLAAGNNPFTVGGTLTVAPLQAPGVYAGTFNVQVLYN